MHAVQAEELRRQLAEREGELAELGKGLGGLERENANLEAQVRSQ
jgi:predicted nuclease with TOPRIM domain